MWLVPAIPDHAMSIVSNHFRNPECNSFMPVRSNLPAKTFKNALANFRSQQFDVKDVPGVANQIEIRKYGCGVVLTKSPKGGVMFVVGPGCIVGGEIASLVDHGYQKFLETNRLKIAATAAHLHALHAFKQELSAIIGIPDYYNLSLGTVSDLYLYDRVKGREPESQDASGAH
jgi:hypothetical protein